MTRTVTIDEPGHPLHGSTIMYYTGPLLRVHDPAPSPYGATVTTCATSRESAYEVAREHLCTMWRRPGATIEILDGGKVVWRWAGWEGVL